jgi:hypothetical protein
VRETSFFFPKRFLQKLRNYTPPKTTHQPTHPEKKITFKKSKSESKNTKRKNQVFEGTPGTSTIFSLKNFTTKEPPHS